MVLKNINTSYCYIGFILYLLFFVANMKDMDSFYLSIVSFITFMVYGAVVWKVSLQKSAFFRKSNLFLIVFFVSVFECILYKLLSYYIDADLFLFSKADARRYFYDSIKMSEMNVGESIHYILKSYGFDDLGAFLSISSIFRLFPTLIFLNLVFCLLGTLSALMIFKIARFFMPRRYAFIASFTFSASSFITTFHSYCLKETIMLFFIIASFYFFYLYVYVKKTGCILLTLLCVSMVFMFRTPTALLLVATFGFAYILLNTKGLAATVLSIVICVLIGSTSLFAYTYDRYLRGGNTEVIMERKNELAGGGGIVNQLADPLAAIAGPFPSINITSIKGTPLYASGLLYRFLLSVPFFIGAYCIVKERYVKMYPLVLFFIINAIGVAISVKGLEVRLSMPHLAMMYIVAFWFLARYDYDKLSWQISHKQLSIYSIGILGLCLLWNLR